MFNTADMFRVFQPLRGEAVVIPGRGGRHWINISTNEKRDIPLGDPAMGGHASFALGMALAQPDEKVVLFDSEGDILMNLGALVTIAEKAPQNLYHFVLDNEVYATTASEDLLVAGNLIVDGKIIQHQGIESTFDTLGIATQTASGQLFKVGAGTLTVLESGNVGIGTTNPATLLDVEGDAQFGVGVDKSTLTAAGVLQLASPLGVAYGGTGATAAAGAMR